MSREQQFGLREDLRLAAGCAVGDDPEDLLTHESIANRRMPIAPLFNGTARA